MMLRRLLMGNHVPAPLNHQFDLTPFSHKTSDDKPTEEEGSKLNGKADSPEKTADKDDKDALGLKTSATNNGIAASSSPKPSAGKSATEDSEMSGMDGAVEEGSTTEAKPNNEQPDEPMTTPKDAPESDSAPVKDEAKDETNAKEKEDNSGLLSEPVNTPMPPSEPVGTPAKEEKSAETTEAKPAETSEAKPVGISDDKPAKTSEDKPMETSEEKPEETTAEVPKVTPEKAPGDDPMDVDESSERPNASSSGELGESTQATAVSDAPALATPSKEDQPPQEPKATDTESQEKTQTPTPQTESASSARPASPVKVSREREEDPEEDEPLAKRAKTNTKSEAEDSIGVASGLSPAPASASANANLEGAIPDDQSISSYQGREIRNQIARIKKTKNGSNFKWPVEKLWPDIWTQYKEFVHNPVDLSMFEVKLRDNKYRNYGELKADIKLLYENSMAYNSDPHPVTQAAMAVRNELFARLAEISKMSEPLKEKSKYQALRHAEPRIATQPRRPSQSQPRAAPALSPKSKPEPVATATSPVLSNSAGAGGPAFALPPNGVPQIRRDSTRGDGDRPKRPINPPKNRDPVYSSKPGLKKRLEPEMKFYAEVLNELKKPKYFAHNTYFLAPVDPVAYNIPTYFSVIKKPMDLGTMTNKLERGEYRSGKEIEKDVRQMVNNTETFNGLDSIVTKSGQFLENLFKDEVTKKDTWLAKNYPPSAHSGGRSSGSPEPAARDTEDDTDDGPEEEDNESIRNLQSRLGEEQDKLTGMLGAKKPDLTMIEIQQNVVSLLQRKLVEEKTKFGSEPKKAKASKKKATNSKPRPKPSVGNASMGHAKKPSSSNVSHSKKPSGVQPKKPAPKKRAIGGLEKAVIADGINELDGALLNKAVEIIKKDTNQKVSHARYQVGKLIWRLTGSFLLTRRMTTANLSWTSNSCLRMPLANSTS